MTHKLSNGWKVIIRPVVIEDAAPFIDYLEQIAGETDFLTFGTGELTAGIAEEVAIIESYSGQNGRVFFVAEVDNRIVGAINFRGNDLPRVRHTGDFGLSVLKEYWGQGIGSLLITTLIAWAKASGQIRKINLTVRCDHMRAICLYRRLGFVDEGRITRGFYVNGCFFDAILMGKCIDA